MTALEKSLRFYQNNRFTTELDGAITRSIFQNNSCLLAQYTSGSEATRSIMAVNSVNTVMSELGHDGKNQFPYTPYGRRPAQSKSNNPLAFNGEPIDAITGGYLLGNGYRLFSPTLQRFNSPDNLSPFKTGGMNAYAYCSGDPVNRVDPSGHFSKFAILPYVLFSSLAITTGLIIASAIVKSEKAKSILTYATIAAGGITAALFIGTIFAGRALTIRRQMSLTPSNPPTPSHSPSISLSEPVIQQIDTDLPPGYDQAYDYPIFYDPSAPPPSYEKAVSHNPNKPETILPQESRNSIRT